MKIIERTAHVLVMEYQMQKELLILLGGFFLFLALGAFIGVFFSTKDFVAAVTALCIISLPLLFQFLLFTYKVSVVADKSADKLIIIENGSENRYTLHNIKHIETILVSPYIRNWPSSKLMLVLKNNQTIEVLDSSNWFAYALFAVDFVGDKQNHIGKTLAGFLGVPFTKSNYKPPLLPNN